MPSGGTLSKCLLSTLLLGVTVNLGRFIFVSAKQIVQRCRLKRAVKVKIDVK